MKKLLALFVIICIASAQTPCPWDFLSTLAGKITQSKTPIDLCSCYQNGRTLVQDILSTIQTIQTSNQTFTQVFEQSADITQLVGEVLDDCGLSGQFINILPEQCIDDLEAVAYTGQLAITDLQLNEIDQVALDVPALYCAVANATESCPFLNEFKLSFGQYCQCFMTASVVVEESYTLYQAIKQYNNLGAENAGLALTWMIPDFLSSCNIAQINLLNQQCVANLTSLYNEVVVLTNDIRAEWWDHALLDLPQLYCLYENATMACPFMQEYAWNPIPVSCQCYAYGLQIFYDLQQVYNTYQVEGNVEYMTNDLADLITILPSTFTACGSQWQLLSSACVTDLQTVYNAAITVWNERENLANAAIDLPDVICAMQAASETCPFLNKLFN